MRQRKGPALKSVLSNNDGMPDHVPKPVFALTGVEAAGPSAILTLLLGRMVVPPRTPTSHVPPVWLSYGDHGSYYVAEDSTFHPVSVEAIGAVPASAQFVRVFAEADILKECDLLDLPPIRANRAAPLTWLTLVRQADAALWCTLVTDAWQAQEDAVWKTFPPALRDTSILVATRAELLGDAVKDAARERLARDFSDRFSAQIIVSATLAAQARVSRDPDRRTALMQSSGMPDLVQEIRSRARDIVPTGDGRYIPPVDEVDPVPVEGSEGFDDLADFSAPGQQVLRARI